MFILFIIKKITVSVYANIHENGDIISSSHRYDFNSVFSKVAQINKRISFNKLIDKIARAIELANNNKSVKGYYSPLFFYCG